MNNRTSTLSHRPSNQTLFQHFVWVRKLKNAHVASKGHQMSQIGALPNRFGEFTSVLLCRYHLTQCSPAFDNLYIKRTTYNILFSDHLRTKIWELVFKLSMCLTRRNRLRLAQPTTKNAKYKKNILTSPLFTSLFIDRQSH